MWADRPALTKNSVYLHDLKFAGEDFPSKLSKIRERMKEEGANGYFLSSLPDIAWLFNLRGDDIKCTPVFYSYVWISEDKCFLFVRENCLSATVIPYLKDHGVIIMDYAEATSFVEEQHGTVMLDPDCVNYLHYQQLFKCKIIPLKNPTESLKAVKNETRDQKPQTVSYL